MNLRAKSTFRAGDFARLESRIVPLLLAGAKDAGDVILNDAQGRAPVVTGDLKDSGAVQVQWKGQRVTSLVTFSAGHAAFVEFGTGIRGRGTYPYDLPQTGTPVTGSWVYDYKNQDWKGFAAQPYLRPALDSGRYGALAAFKAALVV
jgi:hypothetical protein